MTRRMMTLHAADKSHRRHDPIIDPAPAASAPPVRQHRAQTFVLGAVGRRFAAATARA
ncbi:hypothetical protein ACFXPS_41910 [Nocardia sp. NPDC059091]|uniref:hypothetical protein n=1 Tax=unclassified Nocardia TaxID=2637762 RepID=UPI00369D1B10